MSRHRNLIEGFAFRGADAPNLQDDAWSFALDQRAFGPRRLLVVFTSADGGAISLAHAPRSDPPEAGLEPCIRRVGLGAVAAVAFCDEPVVDGPPPVDLADRFATARSVAAVWGVHLVDWFACDDDLVRSSRCALDPGKGWWDAPSARPPAVRRSLRRRA